VTSRSCPKPPATPTAPAQQDYAAGLALRDLVQT
jgi:hypothetical protein